MNECVEISDGLGARNLSFEYSMRHREMGLRRQVEQGFSAFFAKFLPYLMIFKSSAAPLARSTLKNHQI